MRFGRATLAKHRCFFDGRDHGTYRWLGQSPLLPLSRGRRFAAFAFRKNRDLDVPPPFEGVDLARINMGFAIPAGLGKQFRSRAFCTLGVGLVSRLMADTPDGLVVHLPAR
jgi:hypothetical protein